MATKAAPKPSARKRSTTRTRRPAHGSSASAPRADVVGEAMGWAAGPCTSRYDRWQLTQAQLAGELSLTPRQLQNLEERGLPNTGFRATKVYPWPDAFVWYCIYRGRVSARSGPAEQVEYLDRREARAEYELANTKDLVKFAAKERRMYGRELTEAECVALGDRGQYLRGASYLTALASGKPRPPLGLADEDDYDG